MPGPYPLATLAATVDAAGISIPTYADVYESLQASFQAIYGSDAYIAPDSQDGQWIAIIAKAITDCNNTAVDTYTNFSPTSARGAGLSSVVKLNGLARAVPTYSTVDVMVGGQAGSTINNGIVGDQQREHQWALPAVVVIPDAGEILVTATCSDPGAIEAEADTLTLVVTPVLGWQTATNPTVASPGAPVETDAGLRRRQAGASQLPADSALGALFSGLGSIVGVTEVAIHENYTDTTDADGVPEHCVAVVIVGGTLADIASMIALKKTPGCDTFGDISEITTDPNGLPITVEFSRPDPIVVNVIVNVIAGAGYSTDVSDAQEAAITAYIDGLAIGETLFFNQLWAPALLVGAVGYGTFQLASMTANAGVVDIPVGFDENVVTGTVTINTV